MLAVLTGAGLPAKADLFEPFSSVNMNPFIQVHGAPMTRSAKLLADRAIAWQVRSDIANNFTFSNDGAEAIAIDGETHRHTLSMQYGIDDRLEIGIDVPWVSHRGGSLDQFIEQWHKLWGLPNSDRDEFLQDQLNFQYIDTLGKTTGITRSASGIGDIRLHLGYRLAASESRFWSVRAGVKLPNGDEDKLTGSGGTDVYATIHMTQDQLLNSNALTFHGSLGILRPGDGEVLNTIVEDWVSYGSAAIAWQAGEKISLKAQLDFQSAYYDSNLEELGDTAMQLMVGGSLVLGDRYFLDLSLSEDILTDRSPDVVFQIGLRRAL
jgi:hypothetical protein